MDAGDRSKRSLFSRSSKNAELRSDQEAEIEVPRGTLSTHVKNPDHYKCLGVSMNATQAEMYCAHLAKAQLHDPSRDKEHSDEVTNTGNDTRSLQYLLESSSIRRGRRGKCSVTPCRRVSTMLHMNRMVLHVGKAM